MEIGSTYVSQVTKTLFVKITRQDYTTPIIQLLGPRSSNAATIDFSRKTGKTT